MKKNCWVPRRFPLRFGMQARMWTSTPPCTLDDLAQLVHLCPMGQRGLHSTGISASCTAPARLAQYLGRIRGSSFSRFSSSGILTTSHSASAFSPRRRVSTRITMPHQRRTASFSSRRTMTACLWLTVSVLSTSSADSILSSSAVDVVCLPTRTKVCCLMNCQAASSLATDRGTRHNGGCATTSQTALKDCRTPWCKNSSALGGL
mmetsp:Transcript_36308/g.96503  ORF Transcript_36308/g.96503 Transcript_36308/m.96503 type:complete len:205 (-) Transcript_36308:1451-2065(-)